MMELLNQMNTFVIRNKAADLTPTKSYKGNSLRQQYLQQIHGQVLANRR